jgi:hypothetical protein
VNLKSHVVPGCTVAFQLRKFRKLLRAMHLMNENEIMSAVEVIPGLQSSVLRMPNGHKYASAPVLGAEVVWPRGSKGQGAPLVSPALPKLASTASLQLTNIQVKLVDSGIRL